MADHTDSGFDGLPGCSFSSGQNIGLHLEFDGSFARSDLPYSMTESGLGA